MKKQILGAVGTLAFFGLFILCMSPYLLFRIITGLQDESSATLFWDSRMQSISFFIGAMLAAGGVRIICRRHYDPNSERIHPLNDLEEQEIKRKNTWYCFRMPATFVLTGKRAVRYGIMMLVFGLLFLAFGLQFWIGTFLPELRNAMANH